METSHDSLYQGFNATEGRLVIIRKLVLEFAGVELIITPTKTSDDFMKHVGLNFISPEQKQAFIDRMLELGQEEQAKRESREPY